VLPSFAFLCRSSSAGRGSDQRDSPFPTTLLIKNLNIWLAAPFRNFRHCPKVVRRGCDSLPDQSVSNLRWVLAHMCWLRGVVRKMSPPSRGQVPAQAGNMTRARARGQENKNPKKNQHRKNRVPPMWARSLDGIPNSVGVLPTSGGLP